MVSMEYDALIAHLTRYPDLSWKSSACCNQLSLLNIPASPISVQKIRFSSFKQQKSEQQQLASNLFPKKAKVDSSVGIKQFFLSKRKKLEEEPVKKTAGILEKSADFCQKTEKPCGKHQENSSKLDEHSAKQLSCLKGSGPAQDSGNPMTDCLKKCACKGKNRRAKSPAEDQCFKAPSSTSSPSNDQTSSQLCETLKCLQAIESLTKKIANNLRNTSREKEAKEEVINEPSTRPASASKEEEDAPQTESKCDCTKTFEEDKQCKPQEAQEGKGKLASLEDSEPQLCAPAPEENSHKSNQVSEQVMETLSASKFKICEEEQERSAEDQSEGGTCAEEECVRDQTVQKGLKGLSVVLPESEETVPRDMGILRQCMLQKRSNKMPIVQRFGEKLLVGEEIGDGTDPGPFCEENGVEKVLKCALVRDEQNREKFVCTEVYPKDLNVGKAMQTNYQLNRSNKIKITSNKLVCRTCPAVDGSGRKEIFCSLATVEEIKTPSETVCQPNTKKPAEKDINSLIKYRDLKRRRKQNEEKAKEEAGKKQPAKKRTVDETPNLTIDNDNNNNNNQ
ncbi:hypothetical protein HUJ05_005872 [Dendroctonus ponderosae]|nr:hypothetical protein HUJ05_005872 [Dendroctonus ponderosae]